AVAGGGAEGRVGGRGRGAAGGRLDEPVTASRSALAMPPEPLLTTLVPADSVAAADSEPIGSRLGSERRSARTAMFSAPLPVTRSLRPSHCEKPCWLAPTALVIPATATPPLGASAPTTILR